MLLGFVAPDLDFPGWRDDRLRNRAPETRQNNYDCAHRKHDVQEPGRPKQFTAVGGLR
jgi:hypothetical protein